MRADQLQSASSSIMAHLKASDILTVIKKCRAAQGDDRITAFAELEHAGAVLMQSFESADAAQRKVLKTTHLESLSTPDYWRDLLSVDLPEASRQAELVKLFSRVMFASSSLPSLLGLLDESGVAPSSTDYSVIQPGEEALTVKLSDAGERASDPDRIARAIDGLDMLYSACASLTQKSTVDFQLLGIRGSADRNVSFVGDKESISAVKTVVSSIPAALAEIDPEDEDVDVENLVQSLPIFSDLQTLKKLGTFEASDWQDIQDTMYQGVLLTLESGVVIVSDDVAPMGLAKSGSTSVATGKDEYYDQYLREREKLQQDVEHPKSVDAAIAQSEAITNVQSFSKIDGTDNKSASSAAEDARGNAIDNLIKSLKR